MLKEEEKHIFFKIFFQALNFNPRTFILLNLKIIIIEFTGKNMIGVNTPTNFEVEGFNFEYS